MKTNLPQSTRSTQRGHKEKQEKPKLFLCASVVRFVSLWLFCLLFALAACSQREESSPLSLAAVTPEAITNQLSPVKTLAEAGGQMAAALSIQPDQVRVRIQANCIVCEAEHTKDATSFQGLSIDQAAAQLKAGNDFWLFVQTFTCSYHFDGTIFTPKRCQFAAV